MPVITVKERDEILTIIQSQIRETVKQDVDGVTARLVCITCPCGRKKSVWHMFQCLYCNVWYCKPCAEIHFGKTVDQHRKENPIEE